MKGCSHLPDRVSWTEAAEDREKDNSRELPTENSLDRPIPYRVCLLRELNALS